MWQVPRARHHLDRRPRFIATVTRPARALTGPRLALVAFAAALVAAGALAGNLASRSDPMAAGSIGAMRPRGLVAPWLRERGTRFVAADGRGVILRGINAGPSKPSEYRQAARLGANLVRVPVYWSEIEPQPPRGGVHRYDRAALAVIDREVRFLRSHGVAVLIDFHQFHWSPYFTDPSGRSAPRRASGIPGWLYAHGRYPKTPAGRANATAAFYGDRRATAAYRGFAAMMAARYREFANVIGYEILNEPPTGTLPDTHANTQRLIAWEAKIRAAIASRDPLRTVFFMLRTGNDLGVEHADLQPFGSLRHLALDLHDYYAGDCGTGYGPGAERLRCPHATTYEHRGAYDGTLSAQLRHVEPALARTRAWDMPLLIGEWGASIDDAALPTYQAQMLAVFKRDHLSWTRWSGPPGGSLSIFGRDGGVNAAGRQLARVWSGQPKPGSRSARPAGYQSMSG
jgi:Cellulase (glycosyl hydrolase family 5)